MTKITQATPPGDSLLSDFAHREGYYMDAFYIDVERAVTLRDLIAEFYKTPLFRAERLVLRIAAKSPTTDSDVDALATGQAADFAVWQVEERRQNQILLGDASGRTKSWLHVAPESTGTRIWFGSVVVPIRQKGKLTLGPVFHALEGAHRIYSRLLLGSAASRLTR